MFVLKKIRSKEQLYTSLTTSVAFLAKGGIFVVKKIGIIKELSTPLAIGFVSIVKRVIFFLKEMKIKKKLYAPLAICLGCLVICMLIWEEQVGVPDEGSVANLVLLKKKAVSQGSKFSYSDLKLAIMKKKSVSQGNKLVYPDLKLPLKEKKIIPEGNKLSYSGKAFKIFKEVLAYRESGGKYGIVNKLGYLGKYQFGKSTLRVLGIKDTKEFLRNPRLQEIAFILNVARNKWILRKEIQNYKGHRVNGVLITESGIIAAAHLSGPGNVKKYLGSSGGNNVKDAFGTSLQNYMKSFGGFNISSIPAVRNPRL